MTSDLNEEAKELSAAGLDAVRNELRNGVVEPLDEVVQSVEVEQLWRQRLRDVVLHHVRTVTLHNRPKMTFTLNDHSLKTRQKRQRQHEYDELRDGFVIQSSADVTSAIRQQMT